MNRRTFPRVRPEKQPEHHHNVYVVLLDPAVRKVRKFRVENPKRDCKKPCAYVGMTGLTPEERFANHKAGTKAAWVVKRYGLRLLPELYEHLNSMPYEAAAQMEMDLADDLRRAGYTVAGGHRVGESPLDADAGCRSCHIPASLRKTGSDSMKHAGIISRAESLQILKNDLHKAALEKHADVLAKATAEDWQKLMSQIDRDIEKELRRRMRRVEWVYLIH